MDISKLPKWAQEHIKTLERQKATAENELKTFLDDQTPSKIWVRSHRSGLNHYVQEDQVYMEVDGKEFIVRANKNHLMVMGRSLCSILVRPASGNVVEIISGER